MLTIRAYSFTKFAKEPFDAIVTGGLFVQQKVILRSNFLEN